MATVTNLKISLQTGSDNTLFANWSFKATSPSTGGGGSGGNKTFASNDVVSVKPGAKWYNGAGIADFVFEKNWIVYEVSGNRVVINKSTDGSHRIMSPIHADNLIAVNKAKRVSLLANESASTLDHYEVKWYYATGNGVWFDGGSANVTLTNATYSYPSNASKVKVTVKPVAKTHKVNGKEVAYWTGVSVSKEFLTSELPPDVLGAPEVLLEGYQLTAKVQNIEDAKCEAIEFEVYKDDVKIKTGVSSVTTARASYTCNITAGGNYRVRCRAINYVGGTAIKGIWSPYSSEYTAVPNIPSNVKCSVETETSVKISWNKDSTAKSYTVEYTTKKEYFNASTEVSSISVEANYAIITGIGTGHTWFFRVRANNDQGESGWSEIVYKIIGTKPEPPTTWTLTSTAIIGEPVVLYWVHNTEDGSKQNEAQIELTINGSVEIVTVDTSKEELPEDEIDKIYKYAIDLDAYPDGAEILWRVRTRGITFEYSDWSVQRSINTFAPPTISLSLGDGTGILTSFPYSMNATAGPVNQKVLTYHISITTEYTYETEDQIGNKILVNAGDEVFSKVFIYSNNEFTYNLMPDDLTLQNGESYTVTITVSMDSGLTAVASDMFTVAWSDTLYLPDASVTIDYDTLSAYISPFCMDIDTQMLIDHVVLAVYRREFDGSFTEIATNIENYGSITVTDPHPALDYARYRIVARDKTTNVIGYTDIPGIPVGETSIIIQWDESWSQFDYQEETAPVVPPWTGSMLKLKWNIDVSENYNPDTSLVKYIGRKHPVGYYGTQRGVNESWNTEFPKTDKETLYALRRLANWAGNVYVREPSGKGYTAQVTVSMSIKHKELVIPVTLNVVRVEGDDTRG